LPLKVNVILTQQISLKSAG